MLIIGAALAFVLGGCASHDDTLTEKKSLVVSSASIESTTKGVYNTGGTLTNDSIGIYSFGTGYSDVNDRYNYGSSSWSPNNTSKQVYLTGNTATLFAYAPYKSTFSISSTTLTAGQYSETSDLCSGTATNVNNAAPTVSFTLGHVYSRITFSINKSSSYSGSCAVTNIAISGPAIYKTATDNLTPSSAAISGKTTGSVSFNPAIASITSGTPVTASFLMIPAATSEFTGATTVAFTVDGVALTTTLPVSDPTTTTGMNALTAGTNYTINITVQPTSLTVNSVTINAWTSVTVSGTIYPTAS